MLLKDDSLVKKLFNDVICTCKLLYKSEVLHAWIFFDYILTCFCLLLLNVISFNNIDQFIIISLKILIFMLLEIFIISIFVCSYCVECIIRFAYGARQICTEKEKEIMEWFNILLDTQNLDIKVLIIDDMSINAFSFGKRTIAVTRGLLQIMDSEELNACLLHELGHLQNADSQIKLIVKTATNFLLFCSFVLSTILCTLQRLTNIKVIEYIRKLIELPVVFITFCYTFIFTKLIIDEDFGADLYVCKQGMEEPLLQALYKIYDLEITDKCKLLKRLLKDHPATAYRIKKIEQLIAAK